MLVRQGCRRASHKIANGLCRLVFGSAVPNRIGTRRHRAARIWGSMRTDRHRPTLSMLCRSNLGSGGQTCGYAAW
jgi:hypothetical protein